MLQTISKTIQPKFGIPMYGFVIINSFVTASVCGIKSEFVKSRVKELEDNSRNAADRDVEGRIPRKKLFKAYCLQLFATFVLGIFSLVQHTKLLYPLSLPSNFNCTLTFFRLFDVDQYFTSLLHRPQKKSRRFITSIKTKLSC